MIDDKGATALRKWIKQWEKTYGESPSLKECIIWYEWQFEEKELSKVDQKSIMEILTSNT
tara:strand:- start:274 stop:453 length:180 start_codon:yes stop_codon:yes gene_type:complete